MIIKQSKNTFSSEMLKKEKIEQMLADPTIVNRMSKTAQSIKSISPRSDDFLYFSIIFMKAAESSLLSEDGSIKKLASGEDAWGYFDNNWRWHGNVPPHRNNNHDIFPESELKVAAKEWIGLPLCRDHESSSVDGIRGIILDTHYDEKYKQIVGLCALDKANYPDLASKVQKGLVRYGSMGTAVETSVCTECGNIAKLASDYCSHVKTRSCHGEINVGLKPIEYSLVVQPAEPGAILLKCIASLNNYKQEFTSAGVSNLDKKLASLNLSQAKHLESIMKTACDGNSCSLKQRNEIITDFFKNNVKTASGLDNSADSYDIPELRNAAEAAKVLKELGRDRLANEVLDRLEGDYGYKSPSESLELSDPSNFQEGISSSMSDTPDLERSEFPQPDSDTVSLASLNKNNIKKQTKNILEDIMKNSKLKQRSNARRKIAYMQGGSEGREPNTFKNEQFGYDKDKHMHQDKGMGGDKGMFPGDEQVKGKLSRAEIQERAMRRMAYMQGGSEGREPNTFKNEQFGYDKDKHMHQDKGMGGDKGMFPGDEQVKGKLSRAHKRSSISKTSAYNGPSLSTKLRIIRTASGAVDRKNCIFEVFAGKDRVFSERVGRIFGQELNKNWSWITSKEYGKEVCKTVRAEGLTKTIGILKNAQQGPEMADPAPMEEGGMPELSPMEEGGMPELPPMEEGGMEEPADEDQEMEEEANAGEEAEKRIVEMEGLLSELRDLIKEMGEKSSGDVTVNVNTFDDDNEEAGTDEITTLARDLVGKLKVAVADLDESADEMAMVSETYENIGKISSRDKVRFKKLASEAVRDCDTVIGEAKALLSVGSQIKTAMSSKRMTKRANEDFHMANKGMDHMMDEGMDHMIDEAEDDMDELISEAMDLRKSRREALLKQANRRFKSASYAKDHMEDDMEDDMKHNMEDDAEDNMEDHMEHMMGDMSKSANFKKTLQAKFENQKVAQERENYKIKLRRAYDVALDMQRKGLIGHTKTALDEQVDNIMGFDDNAFESFKRSIANTKSVSQVKVASDLGGVNIGLKETNDFAGGQRSSRLTAQLLSGMWDK
jgi:hypothetical protein